MGGASSEGYEFCDGLLTRVGREEINSITKREVVRALIKE